jgi:hypothetical protein
MIVALVQWGKVVFPVMDGALMGFQFGFHAVIRKKRVNCSSKFKLLISCAPTIASYNFLDRNIFL